MSNYETDDYWNSYKSNEEYTTTTTTVELSRTEYGITKFVSNNIRITESYHYGMIPKKKLDYILFEFEIKKKFIFIPYWVFIGKYHIYNEGIEECKKQLGCT